MGMTSVDLKALQMAVLKAYLMGCLSDFLSVDMTDLQLDTVWVERLENSTVEKTVLQRAALTAMSMVQSSEDLTGALMVPP